MHHNQEKWPGCVNSLGRCEKRVPRVFTSPFSAAIALGRRPKGDAPKIREVNIPRDPVTSTLISSHLLLTSGEPHVHVYPSLTTLRRSLQFLRRCATTCFGASLRRRAATGGAEVPVRSGTHHATCPYTSCSIGTELTNGNAGFNGCSDAAPMRQPVGSGNQTVRVSV